MVTPGKNDIRSLTDALRRIARPRRVDARRHLLLGVAAHLVVPVPPGSGDEEDDAARGSRPVDRRLVLAHARRRHGRLHRLGADRVSRRLRRAGADDGGEEDQRYRRADRVVAEARARSGALEEPGRRGDRRRAAQAGRLPGRAALSPADRHSRRTDRRVAAGALWQRRLLPDRRVPGEGRAGARAELPRQRRLRRDVPLAERQEPRHRRRVGRAVGHRRAGAAGPGRQGSRRQHGLEPGRLHLGVPDHAATPIASRRCRSAPASPTG